MQRQGASGAAENLTVHLAGGLDIFGPLTLEATHNLGLLRRCSLNMLAELRRVKWVVGGEGTGRL